MLLVTVIKSNRSLVPTSHCYILMRKLQLPLRLLANVLIIYLCSKQSIHYFCGSDGPKYKSNPKYSNGWPDSPGYAGDWFFFDDKTNAFCGSAPYEMTSNGWWSTEAACKGGDKSQVKIWLNVAFSADQTGCSPEKTWEIPKDQSCKDIFSVIQACELL